MDVIINFIRKNGIVGYIIAITVGVFILSLLILGIFKSAGYNLFYDQLTLPLDYGKFIHQPWSILTWWMIIPPIFFISLFFDLWILYSFANIYKMFLGPKRVRNLIVMLGSVGGLLVLLIGGAIQSGSATEGFLGKAPQLFGLDIFMVGMVAAVISFKPNFPVRVFIFGVVKIVWVGVFIIGIGLISYRGPFTIAGISILVSAGLGVWQGFALRDGNDIADWVGKILDREKRAPKPPKSPLKPKFEVVKSTTTPDEDEINRILDKINNVGYDGLTRQEKETLAKFSDQK